MDPNALRDYKMENKIARKCGRPKKLSFKKECVKDRVTDFSNLTLTDVMCPICLSILMEPVTMPCKHSLCMPCFQLNVAEAALACPLCRKRISIWVRKNTKTNELVNLPLWLWIKNNFKEKVEIRLQGKDDPEDSFLLESPLPRVSAPGEIQQEYQIQLKQIQEEEELNRRKEENASEITIITLQEEEKEELRRIEFEKSLLCSKDLELAKQLQEADLKEKIKLSKLRNSNNRIVPNLNLSPIVGPAMKQRPMDIYLSQNTPTLSNNSFKLMKHSTPLGDSCSSEMEKKTKVSRNCDSKSSDIVEVTSTVAPLIYLDKNVKINSDLEVCNGKETFVTVSKIKGKSPSLSPEYPLYEPPSAESRDSSLKHSQNCLATNFQLPLRHLKDITASYSSESDFENDSDSDNFKIRQNFKKSNKENATYVNKSIGNCKSADPNVERNSEVNGDFDGFKSKAKENISTSQDRSLGLSASSSIGNLHLALSTDGNDTSLGNSYISSSFLGKEAVVDEKAMSQLIEEQKAIEKKLEQIKQDRLFALRLEKEMKRVDRSKGSEDEYSLRPSCQRESKIISRKLSSSPSPSPSTSSNSAKKSKTPTSSQSTRKNKFIKRPLSDKLRQTTLIESISKRQKKS